MVKRSVRNIAVSFSALLLVFFSYEYFDQQETLAANLDQRTRAHITQVAEVNLLLAEEPIKNRQALSRLLQRLDAWSKVDYWRLLDEQGKEIAVKLNRHSLQTDIALPQTFDFYLQLDNHKVATLQLTFRAENSIGDQATPTFWRSVLLLITLLAIIVWHLRWLFRLEQFAISLPSMRAEEAEPLATEDAIGRVLRLLLQHNLSLQKDKIELTEQIRKTSYVDELTELGNQLFFKAEFQVRLHHHEAPERGLLVLLSFVEYEQDDSLLMDMERTKSTAFFLRQFIAQYPDALAARLRHFDFALLLPNLSRDNVDLVCKSIINQLQKTVFDKTASREHFVDIGISAYQQGFDYYKVLSEADMALRNSQLQGGNSWFMYGEALSATKVKGSLKWRSFLQNILDKRQLQLYGQKIVHFGDVEIHHQEILVRVEDGKEILTAETFLPMAKQCGLAAEFDRQVIDTLIKHCLFSEQAIDRQLYSINLFIDSLLDERFVAWLLGKLSSFPKFCHHLIFEIKESSINPHIERLARVMPRVAELGVKWCVERFGAPDEAIDYLQTLPIHMVKIDRKFINDLHQESAQQLLLKSLLISLKDRNIQIFAEGVEKEKDAHYLQAIGLSGAQGFYYDVPKRIKQLEQLLKAV